MAAEAWLLRATAAMWRRLDEPIAFPREPARLARYGFRARLVESPSLHLQTVVDWLQHRQLPAPAAEPNRALRGCLVHFNATAYLFYDSRDDASEQRYTIAHELAHLWLEILERRERVRRRLGAAALDVLDGRRAATGPEQFHALLSGVTLQVQHHLLKRDEGLGVRDGGIMLAEERADQLALELLAPADEALRRLPPRAAWNDWVPETARRLEIVFGLPHTVAAAYARRLGRDCGHGPDFWDWMSGAHLRGRKKNR